MSDNKSTPIQQLTAKRFNRTSVLPTPPTAPLKRSRAEPSQVTQQAPVPLMLSDSVVYDEGSLRDLTAEEIKSLEANSWKNFLYSGTPFGVSVSSSQNNPGRSYLYALNNVTQKKQWLAWLDEVRKFPVWLPATLDSDPDAKKQKKEASSTTTIVIPGGPLQEMKELIAELKEQNALILEELAQIKAALFSNVVDEEMTPAEFQ